MKLYSKLPARRDPTTYDNKNNCEIEPEVGALLYALVRTNKPVMCVEIGTYFGDSAEWIGKALRDNNSGRLVTCDTSEEYVAAASKRLKDLPVDVLLMDGKELLARSTLRADPHLPSCMDFVHLDGGEPAQRLEQLKLVGSHNISPGGLLIWHDAILWYPGMYDYFAPLHNWPHLILPTPVGVAIFQRPEH